MIITEQEIKQLKINILNEIFEIVENHYINSGEPIKSGKLYKKLFKNHKDSFETNIFPNFTPYIFYLLENGTLMSSLIRGNLSYYPSHITLSPDEIIFYPEYLY